MSDQPKPRLAFILQDFHIGGMESLIYRTALRLRDHYDFYFIATHVEDILPKFSELGTAVYLGQNWGRLSHYLRQQRIDIVQYGNLRLYALAALAAGVPVVIERTDGIRSGVALRSKRGTDAVIASTLGTMPLIEQLIDPSRVHLIYNGIDLHHFDSLTPDRLGFADDDILIGRVSRFGGGKNLGLLIDAVRELVPTYPHIRLILVGGNSKIPGALDVESQLRERAHGLEQHVIFTGYVEHPGPIIKGFDIGTCVSLPGNEGIPNSLIECMAAYKPVIATAVDDIPELVTHEQDGLLIESDNLDQLVAGLTRLIDDSDLRARLGAAGRARVEADFNVDAQAVAYHQLYQDLLARQRGATALGWRQIKYGVLLRLNMWWEVVVPATIKTILRRIQGKITMLRSSGSGLPGRGE